MSCPFLSRLSASYVRNYASVLVQAYGAQCPVVSRSVSSMNSSNNNNGEMEKLIDAAVQQARKMSSMQQKCPFLTKENT